MLLDRTFHPDEANQAFTVGKLLETGTYTYKPSDHHGPTLYYAAAPLQKAFGHSTTAELDGTLLRCTPLIFAILALIFTYLTAHKILRATNHSPLFSFLASFIPVALLATSPIFVFFATDFIQEMLLVCFTMMMAWAATGYFVELRIKNLELRNNNSQFTIHNSQFTIHNSQFTILNS